MSLKLGNSVYLQEDKGKSKVQLCLNQDICKAPCQFFRELLHYSHGGSTKTLCSAAACQEIVWLHQGGSEGFPWNEGSLHDGKTGGEAMLPSHGGRKAVRAEWEHCPKPCSSNTQSAEQCYSSQAGWLLMKTRWRWFAILF